MEQDRYIKEKYIKHLKKQEKYGKIAMFEKQHCYFNPYSYLLGQYGL